jgi:hypothetical protein
VRLDDLQPADRGDAGQCFATKAHCVDREQVLIIEQLAGGVLLDSEPQVVGLHPTAVVFDLDQFPTTVGDDGDLNAPGPGIERVLDQFLDHTGRPFDTLAGGDAADHFGGENPNPWHATSHP